MGRLSSCAFQIFVIMADVFAVIESRLRNFLGRYLYLWVPATFYLFETTRALTKGTKDKNGLSPREH